MQDNPMIAGFGKLKHEITGMKGADLLHETATVITATDFAL